MNVSIPQQEGQADATNCKAIAYYNPDIDYKPEGSDPDIKAVNEEEEDSDAEYAKNGVTSSQEIATEDNEL